MRHFSSSIPASRILAVILSVILAFSFMTVSRAEPAPDTQPSEQGWVDLNAKVPDNFTGTVSVLLSHAETGETFTITAHYAGDFKNSMQIPCGEYYVEGVFTSEDRFLYEAITQTDSIKVKDTAAQVIDVSVKFNEAAAEFLETPEGAVPPAPVEQTPDTPVVEEPVPDPEPSVQPEPDPEVKPEEEIPPVESEPSDEPVEEEPGFSIHSLLRSIASGLFSALVFAGVVFICCWLYSRYKENHN